MAEFEIDWQRAARTGVPEAVLCEGKALDQIEAILRAAAADGRRLLLTRLAPDRLEALHRAGVALDYDDLSRTAVLGELPEALAPGIGIVAAGTSDLGVAREAARSLLFHGYAAPVVADVGVAGLWRLMARLEDIRAFRVVIALAGMEGALFSVLAGLVEAPVIAVPTSVGYGVATGGHAALHAMLASCSAGLTVVNVDNGFGAGYAAHLVTATGARA